MRALISVSDKRVLEAFAAGLQSLGVSIFSTGNTARHLAQAGVEVHSVSKLTGFPEILDGRVKTLHPAVHAGILARRDLPEHMDALAAHGIGPIDLVVVNLYPFRETIARPDGRGRRTVLGAKAMVSGPEHNGDEPADVEPCAPLPRRRWRSARVPPDGSARVQRFTGRREAGKPHFDRAAGLHVPAVQACRQRRRVVRDYEIAGTQEIH